MDVEMEEWDSNDTAVVFGIRGDHVLPGTKRKS